MTNNIDKNNVQVEKGSDILHVKDYVENKRFMIFVSILLKLV